MYARDGWQCRCCKARQTFAAHHIIYRSQQGPDEMWNLITLCLRCHEAVHARRLGLRNIYAHDLYNGHTNANKPVKFIYKNGWRPR